VVDKQPTPWIVTPLVVTNDSQHIHFSDGVLVLAKRNEFHRKGSGLLTISRRRNVA
jgi:hypothetical protein